jgi:hypothetical protein
VHISSLREPKGKNRNAYRTLVRKHEGKSPFGITMFMLEESIKVDLREI